jgi:hypothetical protein
MYGKFWSKGIGIFFQSLFGWVYQSTHLGKDFQEYGRYTNQTEPFLILEMQKEGTLYPGPSKKTEDDDLLVFNMKAYEDDGKGNRKLLEGNLKIATRYSSYKKGGVNDMKNSWNEMHDMNGDGNDWEPYYHNSFELYVAKGNAWMRIHPGKTSSNSGGCWFIGTEVVYMDNAEMKINANGDKIKGLYGIEDATATHRRLHNYGYNRVVVTTPLLNTRIIEIFKP